jgi:glycosyltransferase involved in cell wall biosynthesis
MAVGAELVLGVSQLAGDHVAHPGLWGEPIIELATMPTTGVAALGVPVPSLATGPGRELASPLISVLMPVHNPDLAHIEAAITSVRDQLSGDWELCIADDASSDAAVVAALARHAGEDQRIRVVRHEAALGIAGATNAALELACGEYIALLDHDDVIREDALELVARALRAEPSLDMVYTDEDRISADGGERSHWFPKPGWSPDLFHTAMYTCHLGVYRRRLAIDIGGFRSEFDGSQDYDFVLRLLERTDRIGHIPHVLYSWRIHPGSAASGADAKPHAYDAARRALQGHLDRTGLGGTAELGPITTWYRVRHAVDATRRAAVILPLDGPDTQVAGEALWRSMRSWQAFAAHPFEIVFVGPDERLRAAARLAWSAGVDSAHMSFVPVAPCVPRGRLLAAAVSETSAEWLLLLDGPVEAVSPEWLRRLVGFAGQNGVAAAAGVVHDAAGRIEHGGLLCEDGWVLPVLHGHAPANGYPTLAANFRAVSGVALVSAELLASHGGLDAELGALAVVDLCLRAAATGLRSVLAAEVGFIRQRGVPASPNDPTALATLRERWHGMGPDPYYNASYWRGRGDFALA